MDRFTPQGQAVTLFGATRGCLPMTPTLPVPAATPSRSFCSGRSPKKRPSAATSPSIHVLFSPLPLLAKRSPSFCTFSSFSHPSKAGAARPQPTLLRAQEPHFVGAPCSCPPRWGSTSTLGGGGGGLRPSLPTLPSQQWEASTAKEKYVPEAVTQPAAQRIYS